MVVVMVVHHVVVVMMTHHVVMAVVRLGRGHAGRKGERSGGGERQADQFQGSPS